MKTSRLKRIVILMLAMVNVFLLGLLLSRMAQERGARTRMVQQLVQFYQANGVALRPSLIPEDDRLSGVHPARDLEEEAAFAQALLGACEAEDMGGGIYRYEGAAGTCTLRASGAVEGALNRKADDPEAFCDAICSTFGYRLVYSDLSGGSGVLRAVRVLPDGEVFNAELDFILENGELNAVTGSFIPAEGLRDEEGSVDAVTALVRVLDDCTANGEVFTEVLGLEGGYLLQSTASAAIRLLPAWLVTTDTSQYYVNMLTGEVSRAA